MKVPTDKSVLLDRRALAPRIFLIVPLETETFSRFSANSGLKKSARQNLRSPPQKTKRSCNEILRRLPSKAVRVQAWQTSAHGAPALLRALIPSVGKLFHTAFSRLSPF